MNRFTLPAYSFLAILAICLLYGGVETIWRLI